MRPSSDTITLRNRSRLIVVGRSRARRLMLASRAWCILIFRSNDRDCAASDMTMWADDNSYGTVSVSAGLGAAGQFEETPNAEGVDQFQPRPGSPRGQLARGGSVTPWV